MPGETAISALLQRLVAFRTDRSEVVQAEWLRTWARALGAQVRLDDVQPGRVNFLATFAGDDPTRTLLFEAHGDTVGGDVPMRLDAEAGLLYGRGTCDNKAALAAIMTAIQRVVGAHRRPPVTVLFASTCREESGGEGVKALLASGVRADVAVVGEPTRLVPIRAHKGAWRCRIVTHGVAAHSSNPSRGDNAIYRMRRVLETLETRYPEWLMSRRDPVLGAPTMSVGTIHGGMAVNIVPEHCEIEVDWRLVTGLRGEDILADLHAALPGIEITPCEEYPAYSEPDASPALALARRACKIALGRVPEPGVVAWAANAGFFCEAKMPSVLFGPGDIAQAHTAGEFVELRQVEQTADVYEQMILQAGNIIAKQGRKNE
jgi:acetylornithine deacetylase